MTQDAITSQSYHRLKKAIQDELAAGSERLRRSYREEVVRTVWNIGKLLRGTMGLGDQPSAENAALIGRLSKDFNRPDTFFYDAAKFHRLYPAHAPVALSWSHYSLLIRLEDPRQRFLLEKKALAEGINAKDMRVYTRLTYDAHLLKSGPANERGSLGDASRKALSLERGELYHYRAAHAPCDGRVMIDIGFGITREVRCPHKKSFHSGLIVRAVRKAHGFKSSSDSSHFNPVKSKNIGAEDYSIKIAPFDKNRLYTYAASLVRVVDGDTFIARVDLGFRTWITQTFRLRGIDTPEVTCALGRKAKLEAAKRLSSCPQIVIKTYKQEKYGRFLADVFYPRKRGDDREVILEQGIFLNQELLDDGLAALYVENE